MASGRGTSPGARQLTLTFPDRPASSSVATISARLMVLPGSAAPNATRKKRIRALAEATLSEISASSGPPAPPRVRPRSSTPFPIAPRGLMRSWQMREPTRATRSGVAGSVWLMGRVSDGGAWE